MRGARSRNRKIDIINACKSIKLSVPMKFIFLACLISLSLIQDSPAQKKPVELGDNFDYELFMPAHIVEGQKFHSARVAAEWIHRLLANGTPEDIENAEKIVPGLLSCQDTDKSSPHYGAFRWELETPVEDLNAVEFVLYALIPMMIEYEELLSPETAGMLRESVRMGLINIRNIDVHHKYTNILLKTLQIPALVENCLEMLPFQSGDTGNLNPGWNLPTAREVIMNTTAFLTQRWQSG